MKVGGDFNNIRRVVVGMVARSDTSREENPVPDEAEPAAADVPKENHTVEAIQEVRSKLSGSERLIALGALIVLVVDWVLGTLILDEYGLSNISVLIPVAILAAMYFYYTGSQAPWHPLYGTIVKAGAWALAIIAVYGLIDDTIITSSRFSGLTMLFEVLLYVSGALCAVGAWQMRGEGR